MTRPTLTARRPGIEKLIAVPFDVEDRENLRRFAMNCTSAVSRWQIERAKKDNALAARWKGGKA